MRAHYLFRAFRDLSQVRHGDGKECAHRGERHRDHKSEENYLEYFPT
jgi:hypothetical protein